MDAKGSRRQGGESVNQAIKMEAACGNVGEGQIKFERKQRGLRTETGNELYFRNDGELEAHGGETEKELC